MNGSLRMLTKVCFLFKRSSTPWRVNDAMCQFGGQCTSGSMCTIVILRLELIANHLSGWQLFQMLTVEGESGSTHYKILVSRLCIEQKLNI
jgi:hypothetical protein